MTFLKFYFWDRVSRTICLGWPSWSLPPE
jgi:hypothetical protein